LYNLHIDTDLARSILADARRVFVLTGAGVSAESGVPTFRSGGKSLVWRGMPFEKLSSAETVRTDLPLVWDWFDYRLDVLKDCKPNAGHFALARAEDRFELFTVATQNVDGFHREAGSDDVIELHGSIRRARCTRCEVSRPYADIPKSERPPVCTACSAPMRPDVVLFGEMLDPDAIMSARASAMSSDVCLVVGTSALVYPANEFPRLAGSSGARLIEINPEPTPLSPLADVVLRGPSAEILPSIFEV
jgi:NAD-dependent deacetylase